MLLSALSPCFAKLCSLGCPTRTKSWEYDLGLRTTIDLWPTLLKKEKKSYLVGPRVNSNQKARCVAQKKCSGWDTLMRSIMIGLYIVTDRGIGISVLLWIQRVTIMLDGWRLVPGDACLSGMQQYWHALITSNRVLQKKNIHFVYHK